MARVKQQTVSAPVEEPVDGRRLRADKSRAKIVQACLELLREGVVEPRAEAVAERANVGRRTVFRHFQDMESLYGEMHQVMLERIAHIRAMPIDGETWRERLAQLIERRVRLFEEILPIKVAADTHRFRSSFLADEHARTTATLRQMLLFVLPRVIKDEPDLLEALDLVLSIETWRRLRREQGLSARAAHRVVSRMVETLLSGH